MKLDANTNALVVTSNSSRYRKWSGNTGYDDELGLLYDYDDSVANWHKIQLGSLLFISRDQLLIGVGLVHEISTEQKEKELFSCPSCERQTLSEKRGNLFTCSKCKATVSGEQRRRSLKTVIRIQARYERAWHPSDPATGRLDILHYLKTRDKQSAIREVEPNRISDLCNLLGLDAFSIKFPKNS